MGFYAISGLVNGIVSTIFGLFILTKIRKRNKALYVTYAFFCFSISIWSYFYFAWLVADTASKALLYSRGLMSGAIFIPVFYLHHMLYLVDLTGEKRKVIFISYLFAIAALFFNFTPYFIRGVSPKLQFSFWPDPGIAFHIFLFIWFCIVLYGAIIIFKSFKKSSGYKRNQLKYVWIAILFGWGGGATNYFLWYDIRIPPLGNIFVSVYIALTAYAIIRHRLMDIRVFISKALAFLISYPVFLVIPFIFALRLQPYLYQLWGLNWWLAPAGLLLFFATLTPLAYSQLRNKMESTLLAEQKRYQQILLQAANGMVREHNLKRLGKLIAYILKRSVKIKFAVVFFFDKKENTYTLEAARDSAALPPLNITFLSEHPLVLYLKEKRSPLLYQELPAGLKRSLSLPIEISLIVPSFVEGNLLGFVFLGEKNSRQPYTSDDIDVFKILGTQAALAISNCLFLEEFKKAQEKIFTAEKLASIGGMADGVAHQIKNRLNQFSVASGELQFEIKDFFKNHSQLILQQPKLKDTFDYLLQIGQSLVANVKRTDAILKGILEFARVEEKETFFSWFSFREIVGLSKDLLQVKHEIAQAPVKLEIPENDTLYGVKSQILESVYNFLDNAYEAVQEKKNSLSPQQKVKYQEEITVALAQSNRHSQIRISDNGIGLKEEDKGKVFAPFFTTKSSYKSGTGIGLYVVKRMIEENHKGKIRFNSRFTQGTDFFVEIPFKEIKTKAGGNK